MNLPEAFAREIGRVTELRDLYGTMKEMPGVNVAPAMAMMDAALEDAKQAAGKEGIEGQMIALEDLKSFTG